MGALLVGAALVGVLSLLTALSSPPGPTVSTDSLQGISAEVLEDEGITVTALDPEVRPKVAREAAEKIAADRFPNAPMKEAIFAHVSQSRVNPPINQPMWIVSLDVPGWMLVFIDAETGEFHHAVSVSRGGEGYFSPLGGKPRSLSPPLAPGQ